MPETGADCRKKTTVKWSSVDPEFNEQVSLLSVLNVTNLTQLKTENEKVYYV